MPLCGTGQAMSNGVVVNPPICIKKISGFAASIMLISSRSLLVTFLLCLLQEASCLPPFNQKAVDTGPTRPAPALETMGELDAWTAAGQMSPGINIGNTLDNTTSWETGWGNPPITKELIESLARLGFKSIRVPVAWDTYAKDGRIQPAKLGRVSQVVEWITGAGMFCVLNIHWDGGWIDSDKKDKFHDTFATFSPQAEKKYRSLATACDLLRKNEAHLEALNEETNFTGELDRGRRTRLSPA
jgi:hypothetical protein